MSTFTFSYQIPEKSIGGFVIDVFREEKYNFSNDVTDIPVEDGSTAEVTRENLSSRFALTYMVAREE